MNFNFGLPSTPTTSTQPPAQTSSSTSLSFGKPIAKTGFALTPPKSTPATAKIDPVKTTFSLPVSTMTASTAPTFSLPTTATTTATGAAPAKTEAAKTSFTLSTTAATTSAVGFPLSTTAAPTSTTPSAVPPAASMTYSQVEDLLNKWTSELAEQESQFHEQVAQVNGWDKILSDNSTKLTKLHTTIDKVQQQQKKINYDLDFVLQQQKDLENALTPLEKEYSSANYHPDVQRERMYQTAENIDAQIKKMSEDVKETIEHVNETAPSQEKTHPILLISRVLNAHMNTLQWIDENSAQLQSQIESMSRYLDNIKRESDRSYIPFQ